MNQISSSSIITKAKCPLSPLCTEVNKNSQLLFARSALTVLTYLTLIYDQYYYPLKFMDKEMRHQAVKELTQGHPTRNGQVSSPAQKPAGTGREVSPLTQERVPAHKWPASPKGKSSCHVRALGCRGKVPLTALGWHKKPEVCITSLHLPPEKILTCSWPNATPLPKRGHSILERVTLPQCRDCF